MSVLLRCLTAHPWKPHVPQLPFFPEQGVQAGSAISVLSGADNQPGSCTAGTAAQSCCIHTSLWPHSSLGYSNTWFEHQQIPGSTGLSLIFPSCAAHQGCDHKAPQGTAFLHTFCRNSTIAQGSQSIIAAFWIKQTTARQPKGSRVWSGDLRWDMEQPRATMGLLEGDPTHDKE